MWSGHTVRNTQEMKSHVWKDPEAEPATRRICVMPAYVPIRNMSKHLTGLNPHSCTQAQAISREAKSLDFRKLHKNNSRARLCKANP